PIPPLPGEYPSPYLRAVPEEFIFGCPAGEVGLDRPRRELDVSLIRADPVLVALRHERRAEVERVVLEGERGRTVGARQESVAEDEGRLRRLHQRQDGRRLPLAGTARVPALAAGLDEAMHRPHL